MNVVPFCYIFSFMTAMHLFRQRRQSWEVGGRDPRFWARGLLGVAGEVAGGVDGSLNIIISYHIQEVCSKVVTFEEK